MWEFIKYCLYCMGSVFVGSFGNQTKDNSWKNTIVGILTMAVVLALLLFLFFIVCLIIKHFSQKKHQPDFMNSDEENEAIRKSLESAQQDRAEK